MQHLLNIIKCDANFLRLMQHQKWYETQLCRLATPSAISNIAHSGIEGEKKY